MALSKITTRALANDSVTADKVADNAITTDMVASGEIGVTDLADGAITNAKVSSTAAIDASKLNLSAVTSAGITTLTGQDINLYNATDGNNALRFYDDDDLLSGSLYVWNSRLNIASYNSQDIALAPAGNVNLTSGNFEVGGTTVIDSSQNIGVGVAPDTRWTSTYPHIDLDTGGAVYGTSNGVSLAANLYFDGSNWKNKVGGSGGNLMANYNGGYYFYKTTSQTNADTTVTLSERLRVDDNVDLRNGTALQVGGTTVINSSQVGFLNEKTRIGTGATYPTDNAQLYIQRADNNPYIGFFSNDGSRNAYLQSVGSGAFYLNNAEGGGWLFNNSTSNVVEISNNGALTATGAAISGAVELGSTDSTVGDLRIYDTGNNSLRLYGIGSNNFEVDLLGTTATGQLSFNQMSVAVDDFNTSFRHATKRNYAFRIENLNENTRYKLIKIEPASNRRMNDYRVTITLTTPAIYSSRSAVINFTGGKPSDSNYASIRNVFMQNSYGIAVEPYAENNDDIIIAAYIPNNGTSTNNNYMDVYVEEMGSNGATISAFTATTGSTEYRRQNGFTFQSDMYLNPVSTSADTNTGIDSPSMYFTGYGWNYTTGSKSIGVRLQTDNNYWTASRSNVFGQTYPDFELDFLNSDSSSYTTKFSFGGNGVMHAATGVQFDLGTATSSSILNDYETGTWNPGISGASSGSLTMGNDNVGFYTKVGRQVHVCGTIHVSATTTLSGSLKLTGLPFTTNNTLNYRSNAAPVTNTMLSLPNSSYVVAIGVDAGQNFAWIVGKDDYGKNYSHTPGQFSTGYFYGFSMTYETN